MKIIRIIIAILVLSLVFGWNLPHAYATSDNQGTNIDDGHRPVRMVTWADNFSDFAFPACCGSNITYWTPSAHSILQTFDGGFLVTGFVISQTFGSHAWDTAVWIMKLSGKGHILWQSSYSSGASYNGGPQSESSLSAIQTHDHGIVTVAYTNSVDCVGACPWVFKIDQNGHLLWQKIYRMELVDARATSIKETPDHGFVLAGTSVHLVQDGPGPTIWVMKTGPTGGLQWIRTYGRVELEGTSATSPTILNAPHNGYLMGVTTCCISPHVRVGQFALLRLDQQGNILWQTVHVGDLFSLASTSDGGYVLSGFMYVDTNLSGGWATKLDSTGKTRWANLYPSSSIVYSIQQTRDAGYVLAGNGPGKLINGQLLGTSSWLAKLDSQGRLVWQKSFTQATSLWQALQTSDQGFVALGIDNTKSTVLKLDSMGGCCAKITESAHVSSDKIGSHNLMSGMVSSPPDFQTFVKQTHANTTSTHAQASIICSSTPVTGQDSSEESSQTDAND